MHSTQALIDFLATGPDGTVEDIARTYSVSPLQIIRRLPHTHVLDGGLFETVWSDVCDWGNVTTLIHHDDLILEFQGTLPRGQHAHGFFNLQGDQGLKGHIRSDRCEHIAFVERRFMGVDTASIWFINADGRAMLKIFVGRDSNRQLHETQLLAFRALSRALERRPAL
ncbi:MAG: heme utilization cystosolic carrier protein HutX [Paraburkholderia tropica]|uniref:Heme utilization protein HuvX n=1 Tax=Paraburkholderia tropica TaxID=92647 RepID=A0ABX5MU53_9BURK|nr:heme utilization cystosolic carrier protein HutX [Paraburkholderia tropica]MDE1140705.1 heme utilization cystosolic carrier protein HutX [Paraburkholderia tropica]PXX19143.1 heme utilization protein HuvX [Paraburkholderia tropica]PZW88166.1 heme utilization protein HuvX [Paraburkholderia tropica]